MIYVIKGKPHVKVSNYYKQVKVEMKEKELNITPIGGSETKIFRPNPEDVIEITAMDYYNKNKNLAKNIDPMI